MVITAALGYDSYLVMRHGSRPPGRAAAPAAPESCDPRRPIDGAELGCYFCSDVVAPGNVSSWTRWEMCWLGMYGL